MTLVRTPGGGSGGTGPAGPTGPTGAAGPPGLLWRGAWSSGTTYAIGDAVRRGASSYIATAGSTGVDPAAPGLVVVGSSGPAAASHGGNGLQQVFTPAAAMPVAAMKITFLAPPDAGSYIFGIASNPGVAVPVYVCSGTIVNPANGDNTVLMAVPAVLAGGTAYGVTVESSTATGPGYIASAGVGVGGVSGNLNVASGPNPFTNGLAGYSMPFTLYDTVPSSWDLLAQGA